LFGAMALQNSILIWGSQHRTHHRFVDDVDKDPYSAKRGFWFSHMGWILRNYPSGVNDFTNAKDLERDPIVMFQHRFYLPLALAMNIGLPLALGWAVGDLWGVFLLAGVLRLVVNHHFTFFINSLAHMWGSQPYTDENTARDNGALALFTYGEGYHNFHHIFQNDYRNGVKWYQFDPTKWVIAMLAGLKLATGLKRVPDLWIQRAQLAMQFKRVEKLAQAGLQPRSPTNTWPPRLAWQKYAAFRAGSRSGRRCVTGQVGASSACCNWEGTSFRLPQGVSGACAPASACAR
jgi:stearoyl-CoA desaturase (delta-9 desaturase)